MKIEVAAEREKWDFTFVPSFVPRRRMVAWPLLQATMPSLNTFFTPFSFPRWRVPGRRCMSVNKGSTIPESQTPTLPDHTVSFFRILPPLKFLSWCPTFRRIIIFISHVAVGVQTAYDRRSVSQRLKALPSVFADRIRASSGLHISDFSHSRFDN